jgi:hypothetical protein
LVSNGDLISNFYSLELDKYLKCKQKKEKTGKSLSLRKAGLFFYYFI